MPAVYHKLPRNEHGLFVTLHSGDTIIGYWGPFRCLENVLACADKLWRLMATMGADTWHWITR